MGGMLWDLPAPNSAGGAPQPPTGTVSFRKPEKGLETRFTQNQVWRAEIFEGAGGVGRWVDTGEDQMRVEGAVAGWLCSAAFLQIFFKKRRLVS